MVAQLGRPHERVLHALLGGQPGELPLDVLGLGDDQPALGLELEPARLGERAPQPVRQHGQLQLGPRFLVGHQDVALARARRAARHGPAVDHGHVEARARGVVGAGRAHDSGADDDHVGHHHLLPVICHIP